MLPKKYLISISILLFLHLDGNSIDFSDTLFVCSGESVQLETIPNQSTYSWSPNANINTTTSFNPIVTPKETTTYIVEVEPAPNPNLINNGDFNQGLSGFYSDYNTTFNTGIAPGYYTVSSYLPDVNDPWFGDCEDHSNSADNNMLVVDGAITPGLSVWCQEINVEGGNWYAFSVSATNIFWDAPAYLNFLINGNPLGNGMQLEWATCNWEDFSTDWFSNFSGNITICIESQNSDSHGNDFAIDDIELRLKSETFSDTFTVVVIENSFIQIDTTICANESILFEGTTINANTETVFSFDSFNSCDSIVQVNVWQIDTSYSETLIDTFCLGDTTYYLGMPITHDTSICNVSTNFQGCDSSFCLVYKFFSSSSIDFLATSPLCIGESNGSLISIPSAGLAPYSFNWNTGGINATIEGLTTGLYTVTVTDANNCIAERQIYLPDPPVFSLDHSVFPPSCFGVSDGQVTLNISGGSPPYFFTFNDRLTSSDSIINNVCGGQHDILVEDSNNCFTSFSILVDQPNPITVNLPSNGQLEIGEELQINAMINSDLPYELQWFPTSELSCSDCENPITTSIYDISYFLRIEDYNNCFTYDTIHISVVNNFAVYIPNAFSPNGDGVNDFFEIYAGRGVREILSFKIYNRWGALVYQKDRFLPHEEHSWNGQMNGEYFDSAVFTYFANVLFVDGITKIFTGDVLLVK